MVSRIENASVSGEVCRSNMFHSSGWKNSGQVISPIPPTSLNWWLIDS